MNRAAATVLEMLYDRGEGFVAMDELGRSCGLRAGGLAGALEELRAAGQRLEVSPAHGVRLVRPARLDAHLIERRLDVSRVGRSTICFAEVDSTNDVAFEAARPASPGSPAPECDGLVVLAEHQRRGRGRQGHAWQSPPGANILMSAVLVDARLPHEAVTIAAGLAVGEGVESACGVSCQLHWPNDVCAEGRKLAGVLVEVRKSGSRRCVIIGIGINANASPPPAEARRPATDLAAHVGSPVERIEVVRHVLRRMDYWIGEIGLGRLAELRQGWVGRCGILNHRITVLSKGRKYVGRVLDVSPMDGLVLRCDQDVTVRLPAESSSII
jgi:BirA family biotin operon repressor/biotin-[acetyl-CoA-carboxylase] ligase